MIYAGILAAGLGKRMHRQDIPKQFLPLGNKPIIVHTLEQFFINDSIDRIIIVAPEEWKIYTEDLLAQYDSMGKPQYVITGGFNKTESINMVVEYIDKTWGVKDNDLLIAHDGIRPFVTQRIINDNIMTARSCGAANTVMDMTDAIVFSENGSNIDSIPMHHQYFAEQTPQSYNISKLKKTLENAVSQGVDLKLESELTRLYIKYGNPIRVVKGEYFNMKIINPYDLRIANALLSEGKYD